NLGGCAPGLGEVVLAVTEVRVGIQIGQCDGIVHAGLDAPGGEEILERRPGSTRNAHDVEVVDGPHVGDLRRRDDVEAGERLVVAPGDGAAALRPALELP